MRVLIIIEGFRVTSPSFANENECNLGYLERGSPQEQNIHYIGRQGYGEGGMLSKVGEQESVEWECNEGGQESFGNNKGQGDLGSKHRQGGHDNNSLGSNGNNSNGANNLEPI